MGCQSSALIDPTGDEEDRVYTDNIKMAITKDHTKYEFDKPATVGSNAVVGMVNGRQVTIPLSDVEWVEVLSLSTTNTVLFAVAVAAVSALLFTAAITSAAASVAASNK
jgi:hypothetical protein